MRITSKGQVTIPKEIRDEFGLFPGTDVEFVPVDGAIHVRKAALGPKRGEEVVSHLRKAGRNFRMTTDEIMKLTRGEDWGTERLEEDDRDPR
jgi:AbrB family looped-hinge helix DNA binding protein